MTQKFISTAFTIDIEHLAYKLGLPIDTEIDWWEDKRSKKIYWESEIIYTNEGISAIKGNFNALQIIFTFRVFTDDLRSKDITRLTEDFQMFETGDYQEGLVHLNTIVEKDWNVKFEVESESGIMMPTNVTIDYLDKTIIIL